MKRVIIFTFFILICTFSTNAQVKKVENQIYLDPENGALSDTIDTKGQYKDPDRVYRKLTESKSKLVRNVANIILIGGDTKFAADSTKEEMEMSESYFKEFEGMVIDSIIINNKNIYTPDDSMSTNSKFEKLIDKSHYITRERVIRKYLMFDVGDKVDPLVMATNEYILRDLTLFSSAYFVVKKSKNGGVSIHVFTRDKWTIFVEWETGDFPYFGLYDENFLGTGDRLMLSYIFNGDKQKSGVQANYNFRNLFGKYIDAGLQLGVGGTSSAVGNIEKKYRLPGDFFWNAYAGYINHGDRGVVFDTAYFIKKTDFKASFGKSFDISHKGTFLYCSATGEIKNYLESPIQTYVVDPYYHDMTVLLANVGIARQHFFQGNMIYGYGKIEDIPYGFKAELTAGRGYSEQTSNFAYYGAKLRYSFYNHNFGYLNATVKGNIRHMMTYKTWNLGMMDLRLNYFSPLLKLGRGYYMRNFLDFAWTQGFNRFLGEREVLEYNSRNGVRGLYAPTWAYGDSRAFLRYEGVFFTPIYLLHFRMAGFVWGDMAWLGDNSMFWDNTLSAAAGIGIRIKNERLIIDNIEIRLGFGIKTYAERGFNWFTLTDQTRMRTENFNPTPAEMYEFE